MLKQILKCSCVFAALVLVFSAIGALVDTDGNAATNQTLLGDIDMGVGTLGDLTSFITNEVDKSKIVDEDGYKIYADRTFIAASNAPWVVDGVKLNHVHGYIWEGEKGTTKYNLEYSFDGEQWLLANYIFVGGDWQYQFVYSGAGNTNSTTVVFNDLIATRKSEHDGVLALLDEIPDVTLTDFYEGGQKYCNWSFKDGLSYNVTGPVYDGNVWYYQVDGAQIIITGWETEQQALDSTSFLFINGNGDIVESYRHINKIIGYTLGIQTNKVLVSTNGIPTKTSQLENDGPKDGLNVGHPFATTNQIPDITSLSNRIVELENKLSGIHVISTNKYDFSTNVGLYTGVRDIIVALGGTVTNFPAIPSGGN